MGRQLTKRCSAPTRNCRACGHRYVKGDKSESCPTCGEERRCQQGSVTGYPTCRMHGSGSPKKGRPGGRPPHDGIFRHLLPERMLEAYDAAYEDNRLTELRRDIALLEARRADLIKRADKGESGKLWNEVVDTWIEIKRVEKAGYDSEELIADLHNRLNNSIMRGVNDMHTWAEIEKVTGDLRRLKVDEERRLVQMGQMISVEKLMALMGKMVGVIERVVDDNEKKAAIAFGMEELLKGDYVEAEYDVIGQP